MGRMEHVARMEAKRNAYKILFVKLDGKHLKDFDTYGRMILK